MFQMQFEFQQQQLRSQTVSLKEEQEDQQLVQVSQIFTKTFYISLNIRGAAAKCCF